MISIAFLSLCFAVVDEPSIYSPELTGAASVAFSPSGDWLATGGYDGQVKVWAATSCLGTQDLGKHDGEVNAVAFSSDGKRFASGDQYKEIELWAIGSRADMIEPKFERTITTGGAIDALAFSPDGKWLFAGIRDNAVNVYDMTGETTKDPRVLRHDYEVTELAVSADSKWLVTGDGGGKVRLFELPTFELKHTIEHDSRVTAVAIARDGATVYVSTAKPELRAYLTKDGAGFSEFAARELEANTIAIASDGRLVAGAQDGTVAILDAANGKTLKSLPIHDSPVTSVALSPDDRVLVAASRDRVVRVTNLK
jgi:WD40 repeat protein